MSMTRSTWTLLLVLAFLAMAAFLFGANATQGAARVVLYVGAGLCIILGGLVAKMRATRG